MEKINKEIITPKEAEMMTTLPTNSDIKIIPKPQCIENMILMKTRGGVISDISDEKFLDVEKNKLCYILAKINYRDYKKSGLFENNIME